MTGGIRTDVLPFLVRLGIPFRVEIVDFKGAIEEAKKPPCWAVTVSSSSIWQASVDPEKLFEFGFATLPGYGNSWVYIKIADVDVAE